MTMKKMTVYLLSFLTLHIAKVATISNFTAMPNLHVNSRQVGDRVTDINRKAVKLTMRQGVLMNQLLSVYSVDNAQNELCKNHTKEFKAGLRAFEPWALKMFDSSSKLQGGILLGNLVDFGSFAQCLEIYKPTDYGPIYGKHCLLKIIPSIQLIQKILTFRNVSEKRFYKVFTTVEKSELGWSVCVPHTCPREDILRHYNKTIIDIAEGLDVVVELDENYCNSVLDLPVMGIKQYLVMLFLGSFVFLGLTAAAIDLQSCEETNNAFVDAFSTYRNVRRIMKVDTASKELGFLHGLKVFSSFSVVMGHKYIMYIMFPVINQLEELNWTTQLSSTLILGSTVSVDSFFMTSGMLVANGFFRHVTKAGSFNLFLFYLHRYIRITLPLALVILFYVSMVQFLGTGPFLHDVYVAHQKSCQDYWWSAILHIQPYVNPGQLCIYPTWYLSNEMIFYFLSPVVLYPLWKWPKFGYVNISLLYILAMVSSFYFAWINQYNGEPLPVTNQFFQTKYFKHYYIRPDIRAATYIIGLLFGYIIFQTKENVRINKWANICLWLTSLAVMGSTVMGSTVFFLENHDYNQLESSAYLTFSRSAWSLGVAWIMWSCMHGSGGVINTFLSAQLFKIISRITYGIFLLHTIVQLYKNGSAKAPMTFSNANVVFDSFADFFCTFIIAFWFTVFYELPLSKLEGLLFKPRKSVHPA